MRRLTLILFFLLSGCNLFSEHPLSDPLQEPIDSAIIGSWLWNDENDSGFVHIGMDADRKSLLITMVEFKNDGRVETTEFKGHTTKLASHRFLNLKWTKPRERDKGYFFVAYQISGDVLEGAFLDPKTIEKSITEGALNGEILSPGGILPTVMIHASQDELRQYMMDNANILIKDSFTLHLFRPPFRHPSIL